MQPKKKRYACIEAVNGGEGRGRAWGSRQNPPLPHPHTQEAGSGEQRQLPLLGAMGRLALLKGHALDLEVAIGCQVVDGLQVEAVGELEIVSTRQLDG